MNQPDVTQLNIEISVGDATDEELDGMTRQLLSELKNLDVESAELAEGEPAPKGAKGEPTTIGSIVVSTLPSILPAIVALVQVWAARGQGRMVKFKGKGIEFEGSAEDLKKLLGQIEKGKKK
jgi:hypothetical protein